MARKAKLTKGRPTSAAGRASVTSLSNVLPSRTGRSRNLMQLVRRIRDYNADASKEVSNILRLANSGWTIEVFQIDGETPDDEAQKQVLDLVKEGVAKEYGGGLDVLIDMLHLTAATQGAAAMEVELTDGLELYDFVTVNPWLIDFDKDEADHLVPGIRHFGEFTPLNPLQFKYIPIDPEPGEPQGRSPFGSVLDIVFFQMEVLRDLKAAAHFAGYPRVSIGVDLNAVLEVAQQIRPDLLESDRADDLRDWLDGYLADITDMVDDLEPDDAFVHFDVVNPTYTVPSGKTIDIQDLIETIDKQIISGLKSLPIMLGRNEGSTTTHGTVQWQVYAQALQGYQRVSKRMLEWALTLALRVMGRQNVVEVTFAGIRTSDRLSDAQAEAIETNTLMRQEAAGYVEHDEAAQALTGHDAVGDPLPGALNAESVSIETVSDEGSNQVRFELGSFALKTQPKLHSQGVHGRQTGETVADLPFGQQQLYQQSEADFWATYRQQLRAAWERTEVSVQNG